MEKKLEMIFVNAAGKKTKISVDDPRADLTPQEVQTVMNNIIARNIFDSTGGDLISIDSARIVSKDIDVLLSSE